MPAQLDFRRDLAPFLIATIGEFVALVFWLHLRDLGETQAANAALWTGFAVERVAVAAWVRAVHGPATGIAGGPLWTVAIFLIVITIVEVAIWDWWLQVSRGSGLLAGLALLFILIHALHSAEMGAVKRQSPLRYAVAPRTVTFSAMEAIGGTGWLWLYGLGYPVLGAGVLLAGLTVEHLVQGGLLRPATAAPLTTPRGSPAGS
jgi:hypothetical protein